MLTTSLAEQRGVRLQKAAALRELGINPYPSRCARTHLAAGLHDEFDRLEGTRVTVAGRVMSWRKQGGLTFGHVQDQSGRIQLYIRRDTLQETDPPSGRLGYGHITLFDLGDFVEATGPLVRTQRGEVSVQVESLRLLTKTLRPLPDQWHGLRDREAILRRRYLDTTIEPEHRAPFETVARMLVAIRGFLHERGFLEFLTPVIQPQYGGGTARPFLTHVHALDCDMYLAISHELYLKRLIVAGYDRVYTIGRYFRNEGIDRTHQPEFSMIETMTAYENYEYNMQLIEDLFRRIGTEVFGRTVFSVRGHEVDFGKPWQRLRMADAVQRATGVDFRSLGSVEAANAALASMGVQEPQPSVGAALALAFEEKAGPTLIQPTLVYGHPVEISPLAKPMDEDPRFAERFEIFIAGMECGDNWTEQNDPVRLLEVWKQAHETRALEAEELHPLDYDFIEALEHGMPPTTGIGPGIERMAMIFTETENIDEVVFFPMLRPVLSSTNQAIYDVKEHPAAPGAAGDLVLTLEDFPALIRDGSLSPETGQVVVRPRLRFWPAAGGAWRATGYVEVEGLVRNHPVHVAGYRSTAEGAEGRGAAAKELHELAVQSVAAPLRERHSELGVEVTATIVEGTE